MIKIFEEYVNEKFDFFEDVVMFPIKYKDKIKKIIDWPVAKYIEKKTKNLTDEEKLLKIAKIANTLDKWFSPFNTALIGSIIFGTLSFGAIFIKTNPFDKQTFPTTIEIYAMIAVLAAYNSLNKEYRLLAKENYLKIKRKFIKNLNKIVNENDPYGEEMWYDEGDTENIINRSDAIRYNKKFKHLEELPWFGLHKRKDIGQ